MDPTIAQVIGVVTVTCIIATFGLTLLNFMRSDMAGRLERLEKSEADCKDDRLRLERERITFLEEIARLSIVKILDVANKEGT